MRVTISATPLPKHSLHRPVALCVPLSPASLSNNLKYAQFSQSNPWTMEMWNKAPGWQRALYRFAFTPLGFLMVLPFATFGVLHRIVSRWYEHVTDIIFCATMWYVTLRHQPVVLLAVDGRVLELFECCYQLRCVSLPKAECLPVITHPPLLNHIPVCCAALSHSTACLSAVASRVSAPLSG